MFGSDLGEISLDFIFKAAASTLIFVVWFFFAGKVVRKIFNLPNSPFPIVEGFISVIGIFQLFSSPLIYFHKPFSWAYSVFLIVIIIVVFFTVKWKLYINIWSSIRGFFTNLDRPAQIMLVICSVIIIYQALSSSALMFTDSDDMFYIGLSINNLDSPALFAYDPTTNNPLFPVMAQYRFQSWEIFIASFSKLIGLHPAAFSHSVSPFIFIILAYMAYGHLLNQFIQPKQIPLALILLSVFYMMSGYSSYTQGSYLLTRIWQGKSILLHIILPLFLSETFQYLRNPTVRKVGYLCLAIFAGIALNPIAVFILPIPLIAILFIEALLSKNINYRKWSLLLILVPLLIFAVGIRNGISISAVYTKPSEGELFNYWNWVKVFIGNMSPLFILYIVASIYLLRMGDQISKIFFVYIPILYLISIWNPVIAPIFAKYVTSYATYWRLFWLLPLPIGLVVALTKLYQQYPKISISFSLIMFFFMAINHGAIYTNPALYKFDNIYKIPQNNLFLIRHLEENYSASEQILLREDEAVYVPQITSKLLLAWSRTDYINDFYLRLGRQKDYKRLYNLAKIFTEYNRLSPVEIEEELRYFGIKVLVVPRDETDLLQVLPETNLIEKDQIGNSIVFEIPD